MSALIEAKTEQGWMGASNAIALGGRRVYPVVDVPKEIAR